MDRIGARVVLGGTGFNTRRILTPRGDEELCLALYDEDSPAEITIVLPDRTLTVEVVCTYPNWQSFDVDPRYMHVAYANVPAHCAPCAVSYHVVSRPWADPAILDRAAPTQTWMSPEEVAILVKASDKANSCNFPRLDVVPLQSNLTKQAGRPGKALSKRRSEEMLAEAKRLLEERKRISREGGEFEPRAVRETLRLCAALEKAVAKYGGIMRSAGVDFDGIMNLPDLLRGRRSLKGDERLRVWKLTADLPHHARLFADWAMTRTAGELEAMVARFPWRISVSLGAADNRINASQAYELFWIWWICADVMARDASMPRRGADGGHLPAVHLDLDAIESVVEFPDGSRLYGRAITEREHNSEEAYVVASRYVQEPRAPQFAGPQGDASSWEFQDWTVRYRGKSYPLARRKLAFQALKYMYAGGYIGKRSGGVDKNSVCRAAYRAVGYECLKEAAELDLWSFFKRNSQTEALYRLAVDSDNRGNYWLRE